MGSHPFGFCFDLTFDILDIGPLCPDVAVDLFLVILKRGSKTGTFERMVSELGKRGPYGELVNFLLESPDSLSNFIAFITNVFNITQLAMCFFHALDPLIAVLDCFLVKSSQ